MKKSDSNYGLFEAKPRVFLGIGEILIALILIGASILLQYYQGDNWWVNLVTAVLTTIASIVGVAAVWELLSKIKFAQFIVNLVDISSNIKKSGIIEYTNNFKSLKWENELKYTKTLKIAFVYGRTWREQNREVLEEFVKKGAIEIALPDYNNENLMRGYDERFNFESGETRKRVMEAEKFFNDLKAKVCLNNKTFLSSYYLMEDHAIMAPFNHLKEKGYVPAIKAEKGGALYDFIEKEIESIFSENK